MPATITYTGSGLLPSRHPEEAKTDAVRLAPGTYAQGTVIAEIVSDTAVNDVQTVTFTGTPTGGTYRLALGDIVTGPITYSTTNGTHQTSAQAALDAALGAGAATAVVTSSGTVVTITAGGTMAGLELPPFIFYSNALTGGTNPTATVARTTLGVTAGGHWVAYATARTDGGGVARGILKYACTVNNFGVVTGGGGEWTTTALTAVAYLSGWFYTKELTGLDSDGVTDFGKLYPVGATLTATGVELKIT
jgi:hypothetical protein